MEATVCQDCLYRETAYEGFVRAIPGLEKLTLVPSTDPVLAVLCGDGKDSRMSAARKLSKAAFQGRHTAYMLHPGGPLAFISAHRTFGFMEDVQFYIANRGIKHIHLCTHGECGWWARRGLGWHQQVGVMGKVVAMLQGLKTPAGEVIDVIATVYGEQDNPYLYKLF